MDKNDVEILSETWVYRNFVSIKHYLLKHRLFKGGWGKALSREVVVRQSAAGLLPYDPVLDKVVMIEQFRVGALEAQETPWMMEIVAGLEEPNETPEELVKREAKEEAGLEVLDLMSIAQYWVSPGGSNERIALFCGRVDASQAGGVHGLEEEGEDIRVHVMSLEEALEQMAVGQINNAMSIIALMWLALNKEKVRAEWGCAAT